MSSSVVSRLSGRRAPMTANQLANARWSGESPRPPSRVGTLLDLDPEAADRGRKALVVTDEHTQLDHLTAVEIARTALQVTSARHLSSAAWDWLITA